jgi:hypothetical protein
MIVMVIGEESLPVKAAGHDVVEETGSVETGKARHGKRVRKRDWHSQVNKLAPSPVFSAVRFAGVDPSSGSDLFRDVAAEEAFGAEEQDDDEDGEGDDVFPVGTLRDEAGGERFDNAQDESPPHRAGDVADAA